MISFYIFLTGALSSPVMTRTFMAFKIFHSESRRKRKDMVVLSLRLKETVGILGNAFTNRAGELGNIFFRRYEN